MSLDPVVVAGTLVAATALHLGFQLTVTLLVYPALVRSVGGDWDSAHDAHSRAIVPLVAVLYAVVLLACGAALLSLSVGVAVLVAVAGTGLALATTALFAARIHRDLTGNPDEELLRRLRRVDLVRTAGAAIAFVGALGTLGSPAS